MIGHNFIFNPGVWLGEGVITFTMSPSRLRFYTKWVVSEMVGGCIRCQQRIEMEGREEDVFNNFIFSDIQASTFSIHLTNEEMGSVKGTGVYTPQTIAWEYQPAGEVDGFDSYELMDNGDYALHAEFISTDHYRTIVDGRIWHKSMS